MKGNLKSWMFMFAVAGVIALAAACGSKGDPGPSNCPSAGTGDLNAPATSVAKTGTTLTFTCADTATVISGATTVASGCGNTYYSVNGAAWVAGTTYAGTAGQTVRYFSYDKSCNAENVNTTTI